MKKVNIWIVRIVVLSAAFFLFLLIYLAVIEYLYIEDLSDHARFSLEIMTGEREMPGNFILYQLVALLSFFSTNVACHEISLCIIIAAATAYKLKWTQNKIVKIGFFPAESYKGYLFSVLIALSLILVFVIPIPSYFVTHRFYLGNFVPNMWHNSTTILLFPFVILLFYKSYEQLLQYESKKDIWIFVLILLNVFIKPSFFFVFVCTYPLFMLFRYKLSKTFWRSLLPLLLGSICIMIEYFLIYKLGGDGNAEVKDSSAVVISLFSAYKEYSPLRMLPFALIFSLLFPVVYYICNYKKLKDNLLAWYVSVTLVVAILIYFFLTESGPRAAHGNFYWQVVVCVWIFYFQSLFFLLKDIRLEGLSLKNKALVLLYSVHVFVGILFLVKMYHSGNILDA